MSLRDIGEFGFIKRISPKCLVRRHGVYKAIGDDAAAFWAEPDMLSLLTTDLLVERVHFQRQASTATNLGHKALAVNLSDIAAMGGTARDAFVSIAIPEACSLSFLDELYQGMQALAREFEVNILGGDTTGSKQDLIINVALTGFVPEKEILCRDGARPGDIVCTTGALGDSRAGLHLILQGVTADGPELEKLVQTHVRPTPRLREGRFLARQGGVSAAIDVSDGLSSDLHQVLSASQTGARLESDRVPVSSELEFFADRFGFEAIAFALAGGEDYALLFTVRPDQLDRLARAYELEFGHCFKVFGEITTSGQLEMVTPDRIIRVNPSGWNHFQNKADNEQQ